MAALISAALLFYFMCLQLRRFRYRRIAQEMQAEYESQGRLKPGKLRVPVVGGNTGYGHKFWPGGLMDQVLC
jgi:hypothetical protein